MVLVSQPESAGSIRRQIGQMLMKHHHLIERDDNALQPVSPASYDSSLEVFTFSPNSTFSFQETDLMASLKDMTFFRYW